MRTLIHSIIHTLKSLFWALVLLALIVYVFALIFTQAVHGHMDEESSNQMSDEDLQNAQRYYGSLSVTMFSLLLVCKLQALLRQPQEQHAQFS